MKMFDAGKNRMIGLSYGEKTITLCFHTIPACHNSDVGLGEGEH